MMTIDIISAILFSVQMKKAEKRIAGVLALAAAAAVYASAFYNVIENILEGFIWIKIGFIGEMRLFIP